MVTEVSELVRLIPTFCGATIALIGAFGTAYFNQKKSENLARENREREKLEELYVTLIQVQKAYTKIIEQSVQKINFNVPIEIREVIDIPPIVKLDMLVNLYFPNLKAFHNDFVDARNIFSKEYLNILTTEYKEQLLENKQKTCQRVLDSYFKINETIRLFQLEIARIIKI
jgi:hypothetical protein